VASRDGAGLDHREHDGEARENVDTGKRDDISSKPIKREVNWRDVLPVHPAAELFPPMSESELRVLGEDIEDKGLSTSPIVLWQADKNATAVLLDGRNRLDAIEMVIGHPKVSHWTVTVDGWLGIASVITLAGHVDPYSYVISANIHRRHLNAEQKRDLIAKLLKAQPEKSDRQIGKQIGAHHTTVGTVRKGEEGRGEISHVETHTDTKGRAQPAKKSTKKAERKRRKANERRERENTTAWKAAGEAWQAEEAAEKAEADRFAADLIALDRNLAQRLHALIKDDRTWLAEAIARRLGLEGNGANHPQDSAEQRKAEFAKLDDGIPSFLRRTAP
jgi:hypothetical protein